MGIAERKEREKEQRRNAIVKAAEKIFFEKGINNATMDEVAEKAELSKGTLYLYFNNKEDLYYAICIKGLKILSDIILGAVSEAKSIYENLFEIGKAYIKFAREESNYFKVMTHFDAFEANFGGKLEESPHLSDIMSFFVALLKKGQTDGDIRDDIPTGVLAHLLWTQTTGVIKMLSAKKFHAESFNTTEEEIILGHFRIVSDGINPNPEPIKLNIEL